MGVNLPGVSVVRGFCSTGGVSQLKRDSYSFEAKLVTGHATEVHAESRPPICKDYRLTHGQSAVAERTES